MNAKLDDPFYYLNNFQTVLRWIDTHHQPLLSAEEHTFIQQFFQLPRQSQALLVRMVMRRGTLFRASKLHYAEIGSTQAAVQPLLHNGWIDETPQITLTQVSALLTKAEMVQAFAPHIDRPHDSKTALTGTLAALFSGTRRFAEWCGNPDERIYALTVQTHCDRFRLMFFGNLYQDWSEFVLSDLGVFRYETVELSTATSAFRHRGDIDDYLRLHRCRERFEQAAPLAEVLADLPAAASDNPWVDARRSKLLLRLAQQCERGGELAIALELYERSALPGARIRRVRILERSGCAAEAYALAEVANHSPENAAEQQHLLRIIPRLQRKLGLPRLAVAAPAECAHIKLALPASAGESVEAAVKAHFSTPSSPVHYVENSLFNALFGLLCWPAIFAPVPGAFFHPFQSGPADLFSADFYSRRAGLFAACLGQLDSDQYQATIRRNYLEKHGVQCPFVHWGALDATLLEQALLCLPAEHLKKWCEWLLRDIKTNRAGLPDLIQFWPAQRRYRMIEVKGPGDRLQDNQRRWLDYCAQHALPVAVCYVEWQSL